MKHFFNPSTHIGSTLQLFKWCGLIIPPAVLAGSASALFLWSLEKVTALRWEYGWLLFFLPLAGFLIGLIYHSLGRSVEGGNNLIMDEIHEPGGGVPIRMAPLVFIGTIVTHLFGGSAGREGTAVQMGGSLASWFGTVFRIEPVNRRVLLMSGIAAGFGSVFGTPLTGAVFAMEVLTIGRMQYDALIPVLIASLVGDYTCSAWGVKHAIYHINFLNAEPTSIWHLNLPLLGKVVVGGALFGLASLFFSELTHALQKIFKRWIPYGPLRPVLGGVLVIAGVYLLGTRDYLGIGVTNPNPGSVSILSAFASDGAHPWSWLWKTLFTAVTLSSGFKGGEVTPLFFIGATLGNTLAWLLNAPVDLFAGLGFIAVFSGATNTPLACTIMGIELFGAQHTVYFATACFLAYFFSGHSGIYPSQRMGVPKRNANEKWLLGKSSTHAIITGMSSLREQFEAVLKTTPEREDALQESLRLILSDFQSETGTIHWLDAEKQLLQLSAQVGLPPQMLDVIKTIPVGKGIAGQTAAQNKPVTICNLQTDASGVAKPGAKQTGVGGALCVPIRKGDKIIGTLGIGTRREHEYTAEETQRLEAVANSIAAYL